MTEETNDNGTIRSVRIVQPEEEKQEGIYKDPKTSVATKLDLESTMKQLEEYVKESVKNSMLMGTVAAPVPEEKKEESKPIHEVLTRADFRCGNWIHMPEEGGDVPIWVDGQLHKWQDKTYVVRDLDETDLYAHELNNQDNSDGSMYEYVKGIELRDNIMCDDFGFTKEGNDYVYYDKKCNNKLVLVRDGVRPAGNVNLRAFRPQINGNYFSVKRIKYVHEVQNFFYAVFDRDIIEQIKYD